MRTPVAPRLPALLQLLPFLPLLLALLFVVGVVVWAHGQERDEREEVRKTLISDALSLEAHLRARVDAEGERLRALADRLAQGPATAQAMAAQPEAAAGLRRMWQSLTWIDARWQLIAHVPEQVPVPAVTRGGVEDEPGLTSHLVAAVQAGGAPVAARSANEVTPGAGGLLVARYSPGALLRRGVPWWLARKYDVQLVDSLDQVIASTADAPAVANGMSYRVSFGAIRDGWLQLTLREPPLPWYRALPLVLIAGFLLLSGVASVLLRRQVQHVSRAEAAWRTEAAWRNAMEDSAVVALRARDFEGRLLYVNRTFCEMTGYPATALVGMVPPMPYWPPESLEEVMGRHRRNLAGQAPRDGYEAQWLHRDGRRLDVMVYESPLVDAQGVQIGWMGSIVDITERKRLEDRERRHNDTLAHHARLTMLGEVASTLAHELNQPLTAIASYNAGVINSLRRRGAPDALVLGALERLGHQAAQAGRIVQRIREFLTRREPRHEACDLNRVVADATALLQRDLQRHAVELTLRLDPALPTALADPVLVEQVVINLVRNAADAMATAAGERPRRIEVLTAAAPTHEGRARFLRVDVDDSGPGLEGQTAEALCAAFYTTKREGMGMGLAICRSIVEAHHGVLDAGASPLGGARFSFTVPTVAADVQAVADAALDEDAALRATEVAP